MELLVPAELPEAWLEGIGAGEYVKRARKAAGGANTWTWIKKRPESKGDPCKQMDRSLQVGLANLDESSSGAAHDEITARVYELLRLSVEGHRGLYSALINLRDAFVYEVAERRRGALLSGGVAGATRTSEEARNEFRREVDGGVSLMLGHLSQPEMVAAGLENGSMACSCWEEPLDPATGEVVDAGRARDPYEYELTDSGNAEQLLDLADGCLFWVPGHERWYSWCEDRKLWEAKPVNSAEQLARRIAPRVKSAAQAAYSAASSASDEGGRNGGPSDKELLQRKAKKLTPWAEKCGSRGAIANAVALAKTFDESMVRAEDLDANGRLLHCAGGVTLELNDDGLTARDSRREDRCTLTTGVPYVPGALGQDPLWEDYLDTFIPDQELRSYMQRLLGYSLMGGNPRSVIVFLHGPTSSGKSTLVEAASAALGAYGGTFGMSVFKESSEDGPRPDLLRILPCRVAFASETSAARVLHADQIKRLTGGDTISARQLYSGTMVEKVPAFTPFVATNSIPRISGADAALLDRRLMVVPFDSQVGSSANDVNARDALRSSPASRTAILAWLARGWEMYVSEGLDDVPAVVVDRTDRMKGQVSEFHAWFRNCIEITGSKDDWAFSDGIYEDYRACMLSDSVDAKEIMNKVKFGHALSGQGVGESITKYVKGLKSAGSNGKVRQRVRYGLKFTPGIGS